MVLNVHRNRTAIRDGEKGGKGVTVQLGGEEIINPLANLRWDNKYSDSVPENENSGTLRVVCRAVQVVQLITNHTSRSIPHGSAVSHSTD